MPCAYARKRGINRPVLACSLECAFARKRVLEGHFEKLLLVNPQHIKGLNGYKTDPKDAQWIAGLLEGDKLRGSWVRPREIRELRDFDAATRGPMRR